MEDETFRNVFSNGHLFRGVIRHSEILAFYFNKRNKMCEVLARRSGATIPLFMHSIGFSLCSRGSRQKQHNQCPADLWFLVSPLRL